MKLPVTKKSEFIETNLFPPFFNRLNYLIFSFQRVATEPGSTTPSETWKKNQ